MSLVSPPPRPSPQGGGGRIAPLPLVGRGRGWGLSHLAIGILIAALLVAPFVVYPIFLMKVLCFGLLASAFNLLLGYGGLLSFGHAAFFGGAAYIAGHAAKVWGWGPEASILLGTAYATVLGVGFGWLAIRRQGIYFAMVTLALAQMMYFVAVEAVPITGGEDGIQAIPRGYALGFIDLDNSFAMYYFVLVICTAGFLLIYRVIHSPFGAVLTAIRENEPRAISLGYRVDEYKLLAFTLSAGLAGLAGATKAFVFQLASLTDVTWQASGEVVLMTLVGGVGTIFGPLLGAGILLSLENYLAGLGSWVTVIQGSIFVITVLTFRRGIVGEIAAALKRKKVSSAT